jgi:hypothetical protein
MGEVMQVRFLEDKNALVQFSGIKKPFQNERAFIKMK